MPLFSFYETLKRRNEESWIANDDKSIALLHSMPGGRGWDDRAKMTALLGGDKYKIQVVGGRTQKYVSG